MPRKTDMDESAETVETAETAAYNADYWNERVDWLVPMDMSNPSDTTYFVQVNGKFFKMKRGTTVKVPRYVIEQYRLQQTQLLSQVQTDQMFAKQTTDMG